MPRRFLLTRMACRDRPVRAKAFPSSRQLDGANAVNGSGCTLAAAAGVRTQAQGQSARMVEGIPLSLGEARPRFLVRWYGLEARGPGGRRLARAARFGGRLIRLLTVSRGLGAGPGAEGQRVASAGSRCTRRRGRRAASAWSSRRRLRWCGRAAPRRARCRVLFGRNEGEAVLRAPVHMDVLTADQGDAMRDVGGLATRRGNAAADFQNVITQPWPALACRQAGTRVQRLRHRGAARLEER
jgi:hypothetical protein